MKSVKGMVYDIVEASGKNGVNTRDIYNELAHTCGRTIRYALDDLRRSHVIKTDYPDKNHPIHKLKKYK